MVNKELQVLVDKIIPIQSEILRYKELEVKYNEMRQEIYDIMTEANMDDITINDVKFTRVAASTPKTTVAMVFDMEKAKEDDPLFVNNHMVRVETTSNPRAGYIKISASK